MLLYHFTAADYLDDIKEQGLTKGVVPLSSTDWLNAVWLTTDCNPVGHGLTDGREATCQEKILQGLDPAVPARFPDHRAVRITVRIPSSDRKLRHWPAWGKKRLRPDWYRTLSRTGGGKEKTWWLYWGVIPPERFDAIELLRARAPKTLAAAP
jgi:hypothetical protein